MLGMNLPLSPETDVCLNLLPSNGWCQVQDHFGSLMCFLGPEGNVQRDSETFLPNRRHCCLWSWPRTEATFPGTSSKCPSARTSWCLMIRPASFATKLGWVLKSVQLLHTSMHKNMLILERPCETSQMSATAKGRSWCPFIVELHWLHLSTLLC